MEHNINKKRLDYIDAAKGVSMIAIILGHFDKNILDCFCYSFHVPLFLVICGVLYKDKTSLSKRAKRLLIPYLFTTVAIMVCQICKLTIKDLIRGEFNCNFIQIVFNWGLACLYGSGKRTDFCGFSFPTIGAIWFLLALLWSTLIIKYMDQHEITKIKGFALSVILFVIATVSAKFTWFPLSIQSGFASVVFMFFGLYLKNKDISSRRLYLPAFIIWLIALFFSYHVGYMSLVRCKFPNPFINVVGACAATVSILYLCKHLNYFPILKKFFVMIGKYSMVVLCFHLIELSVINWSFVFFLPHPLVFPSIFILKIMWVTLWIAIYKKSSLLQKMM